MDDVQPQRVSEGGGAVLELLRLMGQALSFSDLYGMAHKLTAQARRDGYAVLRDLLAARGRLVIGLVEGSLVIDGQVVAARNPLVAALVERLRGLDVTGFTLHQGMAQEEFDGLLGVLAMRGDTAKGAAFAEALSAAGVSNAQASTVVLREVREDEVVVNRESLKGGGEGGYGEAQVEQITAFLRGEAATCDALSGQALDNADPARLAELILESSAIRQRQQGVSGGEMLGDIVVGCLRRAFEGLSGSEGVRTQKGRRDLKRTVTLLEQEVLERLRDFAGGAAADTADEVAAAAEDCRHAIQVDAVVGDYLRRREAALDSEKRLRRLIKREGAGSLEALGVREVLAEGGLSDEGWRKLVVDAGGSSRGAAKEPGGSAGGGQSETLAVMLGELSRLLERVEPGGRSTEIEDRVKQTLSSMETAVEQAADAAEERLQQLQQAMDGTEAADPAVRRQARHRLAELVQELCQPMAVVNCTLDMIYSRRLGDVPEIIDQALEVAVVSGRRMKGLVDRLVDVCGVPKALEPDRTGQA
jgi:hypothetical protein